MRAASLSSYLFALVAGCGSGEEPAPSTSTPAVSPSAEPAETPSEEACARVVVVAYDGAQYAAAGLGRSPEDARSAASVIRARVAGGESLAAIAERESDAATSGPRGGLIGTYSRAEWPEVHGAIRDHVFGLEVGEVSDVLEAPYGFVVAERCPVEKVHTRHILVRFTGARNADGVTRTEDEARALADQLYAEIARGAPFGPLARERSEDEGTKSRGGDLGPLGRGRLAVAFEEAAFSLAPGELSRPVKTEFGYHLIQRVSP